LGTRAEKEMISSKEVVCCQAFSEMVSSIAHSNQRIRPSSSDPNQ
jgi:hypothetical protein